MTNIALTGYPLCAWYNSQDIEFVFMFPLWSLREVIPISSTYESSSPHVMIMGSSVFLFADRATAACALSKTPPISGISLLAILGATLTLFCLLCLLITLRSQKTERLLRQNYEDIQLILKEARLSFWNWHLPTGMISTGMTATSAHDPTTETTEDIDTWNDRIHPDDIEKVLATRREYIEGKTPSFRCEHRMKANGDNWKWVISSGRITSRDRAGNPIYLSGMHMDITELRESQKELRDKQTLLQAFMRFFPGSAFIKDPDSHVVYANTLRGESAAEPRSAILDETRYSPEVTKALSLYDKRAREEGAIDFLIDLPDQEDTLRTFHFFKFRIDREDNSPLIGNLLLDVDKQKKQEEAFRSLLNALPAPALLLDREEVVLAANLSACRKLGRPLEDVIDRSYGDLLQIESIPLVREYIDSMKRTLRNVSFEEERGGTFFRNSFFPILDSGGKYHGFAAVAFNVTRTKQAERSLRTSESQLRTVIDTVPHRISTQDASGRFVLLNQAAASIYGLSPNDMRGLRPEDLLPADNPSLGFGPNDIKVIKTGQPLVIPREEVVDRRGEKLFQKTIKMPILLSDSGEKGLLSISVDITDLVRAENQIRKFTEELEEKVRQRTEELEAANRELTTFAYTVSHDLRAPLRAMEGFARILIEEKGTLLDEEGRRFLERIAGAGRKMNLLIEGLLQFSRGSRSKIVHLTVPLSEIVKEISCELHATDPARDVHWKIMPGLTTSGDPQLLKIALENLLGNAWKFTAKQASTTIEFGVTAPGGKTFFVKDNGPGFEKNRSEIIFDVFQRLHPDSVYEGSGIGLATVRRILERHGGRVWASSEERKGATFFFCFPREHQKLEEQHSTKIKRNQPDNKQTPRRETREV